MIKVYPLVKMQKIVDRIGSQITNIKYEKLCQKLSYEPFKGNDNFHLIPIAKVGRY